MRRTLLFISLLAVGVSGGVGVHMMASGGSGGHMSPPGVSVESAAREPWRRGEAISPLPHGRHSQTDHSEAPLGDLLHVGVPSEAIFLSKEGLRGDRVESALQSPKFEMLLARIERESDAQGLANANRFREAWSTYLRAANPRYNVERIACTRSLCFAAISTPNMVDQAEFESVATTMAESAKHRIFALMAHRVHPSDGGTWGYRVAFTVVPNRAGITVPIEKPKPASPRG